MVMYSYQIEGCIGGYIFIIKSKGALGGEGGLHIHYQTEGCSLVHLQFEGMTIFLKTIAREQSI